MKTKPITITKVFTKYDEPYEKIHVPFFADIVASSLDDDAPIGEFLLPLNTEEKLLTPTKIVKGVEGVMFVTYSEKKAKNKAVVFPYPTQTTT